MWEISLGGQITAFLYSLLLGAALCLLYDIIRATRKSGADSFLAVFAGDILFWAISAVVVFIFLVAVTNGEIRGYVLFSAAAGFLIYRFTAGRPVFFLLCLVFSFLSKIFSKFSFAVSGFCAFLERKMAIVSKKTVSASKSCALSVKKLLKIASRMLYTNKKSKDTENDLNE